MNEVSQEAKDNLKIQDVYLRESNTALFDGFEPKFDSEFGSLELQFKHVVTHSNILELQQDSDESIKLFRVFVEFGTRWVLSQEEKAPEIKAHIEATMVADYQMAKDLDQESLKIFALKNASYHVWPYWREFLSSQCTRMNLPKVTMPTMQVASNSDD